MGLWKSCLFNFCADMYFSCFAKKSTKRRRHRRGATSKSALSYVPLPPHRHPAFKNVPIFERLQLKNYRFLPCRYPKIGTFSGYGWRCGGGFQRGRICVAPLWLTSFGPFLVQRQEKDITAPLWLPKGIPSCNPYEKTARNFPGGYWITWD